MSKDISLYGLSLKGAVSYSKPEKVKKLPVKQLSLDQPEEAYLNQFKLLVDQFDEIQLKYYSSLIGKVVSFIGERDPKNCSYDLIPTCFLSLGVSLCDNSFAVRTLLENLNSVSPLTLLISGSDTLSWTYFTKRLANVIINEKILEALDIGQSTRWPCDLSYSMLAKIYAKYYHQKQPIVVVIEDFETVDHVALKDIIITIGEYIDTIPVILIISVATNAVLLHNLLPAKAVDCLDIKSFCSQSSFHFIDEFMNQIIMSASYHIKLGPNMLCYIRDIFLFYDFSPLNVLKLLKLCLVEHFRRRMTTMLCCPASKLKKRVKRLTQDDIDEIKLLPSLKNVCIPKNDLFKVFLLTSMKDLHSSHEIFVGELMTFFTLTKDLPHISICSSFQLLYIVALKGLTKSTEFKKVINLMTMMSPEEWTQRICRCEEECDDSMLVTVLTEAYERYKSAKAPDTSSAANKVDLKGCRSRNDWRNKLKEAMGNNKHPSKFEIWKQETMDSIVKAIDNLPSPLDLPLNEIIFFDDISSIRQYMSSPKISLIHALKSPSDVLQCCTSSALPDICVTFKLYSEGPPLINLSDTLDSFQEMQKSNSNPAKSSPRKKSKKTETVLTEEQKLTGRYFNSIADLEYLGFIQPSRRKTDHMMKLVWE